MPELIPISVTIADRTYRIKVEPKDEEKVRKTVKFVNDKILEFRTGFAGKDMQDFIAMALLWFATEQNDNALGKIMEQEMLDKLTAMESLIDKTLQNK